MTGFARAKEDRPTLPEVYNWRVYVAAIVISIGIFAFGYDAGFIGTTITQPSFERDFGLLNMSVSEQNAVSSNITLNIIFCTIATDQLGLIYAGRLLTGIGIGGISAVSPVYISELAPPAIRGRLTGFFECSYQIGSVIGFWINYGIGQNIDTSKSIAWRIPMAVQIIPSGLLMLMIPILKESPTWLLKKNRDEEAYRAYSYLRNLPVDHSYVVEDVAFVQGQIRTERTLVTGGDQRFSVFLKGVGKESIIKGIRNRFALVFLMFMWQAWSGAAVINYYSPTIFTSIGLTNVTFWTGIYGLIKAICSLIFFICFIDTFGRKWPWIASCILCAVCQYYLAGYIAVGKPSLDGAQSASTIAGGKAATAAIMIFAATWSFGANGLPWIISSEIFSSSLRSVSGPFAAMSQWLWTYVVTKALPSMYTSMGYGIYVFFATALICAAVYAFFFINETKGLRMDQMDQLFGCTRLERSTLVTGNDEGGWRSESSEDRKRETTSNVTHLEL